MTDREQLDNIISNPSQSISLDWVEEMRAKYPYFITPALLYLKREGQKIERDERDKLLNLVSLMASDRSVLADIVGDDAGRFDSFYPEEEPAPEPTTNSTIDVFLNRYGSNCEKETEALESILFNPTPTEYTFTADEEIEESDLPKSEQDSLIDSFLAKGPIPKIPLEETKPEPQEVVVDDYFSAEEVLEAVTQTPVEEVIEEVQEISPAPQPEDNSTLSESLANVYIKQKKYEKAYAMLKSIGEKYPERNPHIQDQLRFLSKLIAISKR